MKTRMLLLLFALSVACTRAPGTDREKESANPYEDMFPKPPPLTEQVSKLEARIALLESRIADLESSEATVTTEEEAYGIARTVFGPFTVVCVGVTPYLDGFKIKLAMGNLTAATFQGAKLRVTWGPPFDERNPERTLKHRDINVTNTFSPGSVSITEIIVTPAKPDEIKSIGVGIELRTIAFDRRSR